MTTITTTITTQKYEIKRIKPRGNQAIIPFTKNMAGQPQTLIPILPDTKIKILKKNNTYTIKIENHDTIITQIIQKTGYITFPTSLIDTKILIIPTPNY